MLQGLVLVLLLVLGALYGPVLVLLLLQGWGVSVGHLLGLLLLLMPDSFLRGTNVRYHSHQIICGTVLYPEGLLNTPLGAG